MDVWKHFYLVAFAGSFICVTSQYTGLDILDAGKGLGSKQYEDISSDSVQKDTRIPVVLKTYSPKPNEKPTTAKPTTYETRTTMVTTIKETTKQEVTTANRITPRFSTTMGETTEAISTEKQSAFTRPTPMFTFSESSETTTTTLPESSEAISKTFPELTGTISTTSTKITTSPSTSMKTETSKKITLEPTTLEQLTETSPKAKTQTQTTNLITKIQNTPRIKSTQIATAKTTTKSTSKNTTPLTTVVTSPPIPTQDPRANKTVCYGGLGCFDNRAPFNNAVLDLPNSPEKVGTNIHLYTRQNPTFTESQILDYTNETTFKDTFFNPAKRTKVIIHGFSNTFNSTWLHTMKDEFLKNDDFNIVIVAWGPGATFPDYAQAVANTRLVATQTHRTILQLLKLGARLEDMHLLGHSLGAHTCGYCGHLFNGKLGRITGLDPADPDFDTSPPLVILDPSDAIFVDIIHSNGAPLTSGGAGMYRHSGHVDFYPNGGKSQPGCSLFSGQNIVEGLACSHGRSHELFIESINTRCPFTAYPCSNYDKFQAGQCLDCGFTGCSVLGYYSDQYYARGSMYMNTQSKSAYCGYHYGVTVTGAKSTEETKGKLYLRLKGTWGDSGFVPVSTTAEKLKVGAVFSHVMVSPVEVGEVQKVLIKYEKYSGFWIGGGKDSYSVERVKVVSGENGDSYKFCLLNKELKHNTEVEAVKSSSQYLC